MREEEAGGIQRDLGRAPDAASGATDGFAQRDIQHARTEMASGEPPQRRGGRDHAEAEYAAELAG
jgi:hypothetical protein